MPPKQSHLEAQLLAIYGPLLTYEHLATLLHRKPGGLVFTLNAPGPVRDQFEPARLQIGRRVYYRASDIAAILAGCTDGL
jgi:hypothetical protein